MVASTLNCEIVAALAREPMRQAELLRATGSPAQTTLRAQLRRLADFGVIEAGARKGFPGAIQHSLTEAGHDLLDVIAAARSWLEQAPENPIALGSSGARASIKALTEAWSTTILRAISARATTLTELSDLITSVNYPSIERRLTALRRADLVEVRDGGSRGNPYAPTRWLRQGIGPLAAAIGWERRHRATDSAPLGTLDVETGFLLAVPLLRLREPIEGSCRLVVELDQARERYAGVSVTARGGRIGFCTTQLKGHADGWAVGPPGIWLSTLIEYDDGSGLELGGDHTLVRGLIEGIRAALFPRPAANGGGRRKQAQPSSQPQSRSGLPGA